MAVLLLRGRGLSECNRVLQLIACPEITPSQGEGMMCVLRKGDESGYKKHWMYFLHLCVIASGLIKIGQCRAIGNINGRVLNVQRILNV